MKNFKDYLVSENVERPGYKEKPLEPFQKQLERMRKEYKPHKKMYEKMFPGSVKKKK